MAYLLVVRATLLEKLEVMEERYEAASQQCKDMDRQISVSRCDFVLMICILTGKLHQTIRAMTQLSC